MFNISSNKSASVSIATCNMSNSGYIHVHNKELCAEVLGCAVELNTTTKSAEVATLKTNVTRNSSKGASDRCAARVPSTSHTNRINEWLASKARRTVVSLPDSPEMKALKVTCDALQKREQHVLSELDDFLMSEASQQQCKKEMLYKKWSERVFTPINSAVSDKMEEESYNTNDCKKRQLFDDYLTYSNQRIVFLDTIGNDYRPLAHLSTPLKIKTEGLDDPLLAQQVEADSEKVILRGCNVGYPPPKLSECVGRKDTNPVLWLAMELVEIDSKIRCKRSGAMNKSRNQSSLLTDKIGGDLPKDELKLPHKKRITYERQPFDLHWTETSSNNDCDKTII